MMRMSSPVVAVVAADEAHAVEADVAGEASRIPVRPRQWLIP
jgi:hypothetical protein